MPFKQTLVKAVADSKFYVRKNSPEILMGAGLACLVGSIAYTVVGTLNAGVEIADMVEDIDELDSRNIADKDQKKEKRTIYISSGINIARDYVPAIVLATASAACLIGSNTIMRHRALSIAAAYSALDVAFSDYRKRVIEEYGVDVDRSLRYGLKNKEIDVEHIDDETGEVTHTTEKVVEKDDSPTNVWYQHQYELPDGSVIVNPNWCANRDLNATYIKAQMAWFNGCLSRGEHVWLDDIYKALGIPVDGYRPETHMLGWTPSKDQEKYISCNSYNTELDEEFIYDEDGDILLEFNPDGILYYNN